MKDVTNSASDNRKTGNRPGGNQTRRHKIYAYLILLVTAAIAYYLILPPIHYAAPIFWVFLLGLTLGSLLIESIFDGHKIIEEVKTGAFKQITLRKPKMTSKYKWAVYLWLLIAAAAAALYLIFSPVIFPTQYANMIQPQTANFQEDFPEVEVDQIPLIDRDTATRLGSRTLGSLSELVSQFEAAPDYTQINIANHPYRVSPLKYAGLFKWINNFQQGIPNYIQVDMVSGDVELKTPAQPIKYSFDDKFNRNVHRRLRFSNPFALFGEPSFEIDDAGNPYYVATTYTRNFILREPEANGVVLLNAMTGETERLALEDVPQWVDRVHTADLIMHQLTMNGLYRNGFLNSIFAKNGVTRPTEGYNYLPMKDDIYMYTGITSVVTDESNIGFVLVNMRTKEAKMYYVTAAEEFSAMSSAEGSVQEKGYIATFPLLINLNGKPMYILSLKDAAGLIKEYALVDVQNYQNVYIAQTVPLLITQYAQVNNLEIENVETESDIETINGKIDQIQAVVVDGDSVYYFTVKGEVYRANIKISERLPFIENGAAVEFDATAEGEVKRIEIIE